MLKLSRQEASFILSHGYGRGFRFVFILNACWAAVATLASILLIKQNDLSRQSNHRTPEEMTQMTDDNVTTTTKVTANMA